MSTRKAKASAAKRRPDSGERFDEILKHIQDDIVVGVTPPGTRLDERTLAERFRISRTPIREVLRKMSSLGIVDQRRNKGAFVAEISSSRLVGMLDVMAELKVLAARQAARRMNIEERRQLAALGDEMAACAKDGDLQPYFDKASALHEAICAGTHNEFLVESVHNIQLCMCAYRRHLSQILHMPIRTSLEENSNIVAAVVEGDSAKAEYWMRQQTEFRRDEFSDLITLVAARNTAP